MNLKTSWINLNSARGRYCAIMNQNIKKNQLDHTELSDDAIIQAIIANPILMQRPIVIFGDKAIIGRPPEKVLELL